MEKTLDKNPICSAMAGIISVQYADIKNVENYIPYSDGIIVSLKRGHAWSIIETDGITASCRHEGGGAYRHEVGMVYHGHQAENDRALMEMTGHRFLLRITDNNGTMWLYGTKECPLHMSYEYTNDGEADGETAYRLTFSALCPVPRLRVY